MHAEIAVMHLVEHRIGYILEFRAFVFTPAGGIGRGEIYDCGALAIGTYGLGPDTGCLGKTATIYSHTESVELAVKFFGNRRTPGAVFSTLHRQGCYGSSIAVGVVYQHFCSLCFGRPEGEMSAGGINAEFEVGAVVYRP